MNTDGPTVLRLGPYVAALVALVGFAARLVMVQRRQPGRADAGVGASRLLGGGFLGRVAGVGLVLLLVAHALAMIAPDSLRRALGVPGGLYLLEGAGFALGLLVLLGTVAGVGRHILTTEGSWAGELGDGVFLSALLVSVGCGLAVAGRHRWASLWSLGTMVPYVRSVVRGSPAPALVTGTPFAAQLHVVASLAALAALPLSRLGEAMALAVVRVAGVVATAVEAPAQLALRVTRPHRFAAWLWPEEDLADLARQQRRATAAARRVLVGQRTRGKAAPVVSGAVAGSVSGAVSMDGSAGGTLANGDAERASMNVEGGG